MLSTRYAQHVIDSGTNLSTFDDFVSFDFVKARAIESTLKDKLAESPLCSEHTDIDTEIRHKRALQSTTQKLVDCVTTDCEPSLESLRMALQALKTSILAIVPESAIAGMLDRNSINDEGNDPNIEQQRHDA
mmetsp:Transcript_21625/g.51245  ORF Transcript_21625/g.51245 Transcript_21625/m.51245 type:complete len:132 (+) Transcript_21625:3361-3756(+)